MPEGNRSTAEEERIAQDRALETAEARLRSGRVLRRTLSFDGFEERSDIPDELLIRRFGTADPIALRLVHNFRTPQRRNMAHQLRIAGSTVAQDGAESSALVGQASTTTGEDNTQATHSREPESNTQEELPENPPANNQVTDPIGSTTISLPGIFAGRQPGADSNLPGTGIQQTEFRRQVSEDTRLLLEQFQANMQETFRIQLQDLDSRYVRRNEVLELRNEVRSLAEN